MQKFLITVFIVNITTLSFCAPLKIQRIISLGPSITAQLYLLGVQDKLIGCTVYCKIPIAANVNLQKVATAVNVNVEKVVSLKPDLVLATSLTDIKAVNKLKSLGINVVQFSLAHNFEDICGQFIRLGELIDKKKEAEKNVNKIRIQVDNIKKKAKNFSKQTVFVQVGAKPLFTITKEYFINDVIEFAGGLNVAKDAKTGIYNREEVLKRNPDVIIITTMGVTAEEEKKTWYKFNTLNAVKNNRIYIVNSDKFCTPTPINFVVSLEEMINILHK
ncbi:MAG: helical backbone metal receptor [Candidatus Firestonebacteria bacterium]